MVWWKNWLSSFAARWHWQPAETASRKKPMKNWRLPVLPTNVATTKKQRHKSTVSRFCIPKHSRPAKPVRNWCWMWNSRLNKRFWPFWTVLSRQSKQRLTPSKASTPWRKMPNISKWVTTYGLHKPSRRISIVPSFASKWASRELWAWLPFIVEPAISIM